MRVAGGGTQVLGPAYPGTRAPLRVTMQVYNSTIFGHILVIDGALMITERDEVQLRRATGTSRGWSAHRAVCSPRSGELS